MSCAMSATRTVRRVGTERRAAKRETNGVARRRSQRLTLPGLVAMAVAVVLCLAAAGPTGVRAGCPGPPLADDCYGWGTCTDPATAKCTCYVTRYEHDGRTSLLAQYPSCQYSARDIDPAVWTAYTRAALAVSCVELACTTLACALVVYYGRCGWTLQAVACGSLCCGSLLRTVHFVLALTWTSEYVDRARWLILFNALSTFPDAINASIYACTLAFLYQLSRDDIVRHGAGGGGRPARVRTCITVVACTLLWAMAGLGVFGTGWAMAAFLAYETIFLFFWSLALLYFVFVVARKLLAPITTSTIAPAPGSATTPTHATAAPWSPTAATATRPLLSLPQQSPKTPTTALPTGAGAAYVVSGPTSPGPGSSGVSGGVTSGDVSGAPDFVLNTGTVGSAGAAAAAVASGASSPGVATRTAAVTSGRLSDAAAASGGGSKPRTGRAQSVVVHVQPAASSAASVSAGSSASAASPSASSGSASAGQSVRARENRAFLNNSIRLAGGCVLTGVTMAVALSTLPAADSLAYEQRVIMVARVLASVWVAALCSVFVPRSRPRSARGGGGGGGQGHAGGASRSPTTPVAAMAGAAAGASSASPQHGGSGGGGGGRRARHGSIELRAPLPATASAGSSATTPTATAAAAAAGAANA